MHDFFEVVGAAMGWWVILAVAIVVIVVAVAVISAAWSRRREAKQRAVDPPRSPVRAPTEVVVAAAPRPIEIRVIKVREADPFVTFRSADAIRAGEIEITVQIEAFAPGVSGEIVARGVAAFVRGGATEVMTWFRDGGTDDPRA